ncbi:MAG: 2-succinyl-6-hydroxy-2,4-cyclohexadiene-1-carboxylate synthase [Bacillota bacterium]|nr:2-succinyl-6-hydroxy-2,4-cyclohexadiene-1-carboxylate synthase [Bacillota bacterium]
MNFVIHGMKYHVEVCGNGYPLLLLHGFTGSSSAWLPFSEEWSAQSRLIMPDLAGHGETEAPADLQRYKIESVAHDLNQLLEELDIDQVDVLGYSMGGRLALTFAILFPEKVRKLVLVSSTAGIQTEEDRNSRRMKDAQLAKFIKDEGVPAFIRYWENIPLFQSMANLPDWIKNAVRSQRLQNTPEGLANSLLGMGTGSQPSWWGKLGTLTLPILLLTGSDDEKFCRIASEMQKKLKRADWICVEGSGHAIHVEKSEKFGTIVSEFLLNT